ILDLASGTALRLGTGNGTFAPAVDINMRDVAFYAAGDFNRDGGLDLAAVKVTADPGAGVLVALGNGDGTVQAAIGSGTPAAIALGEVATDFNFDGRADVAVLDGGNPATLRIFLGMGNGQVQPTPVSIPSCTSMFPVGGVFDNPNALTL